jgi:hypothetical protein
MSAKTGRLPKGKSMDVETHPRRSEAVGLRAEADPVGGRYEGTDSWSENRFPAHHRLGRSPLAFPTPSFRR